MMKWVIVVLLGIASGFWPFATAAPLVDQPYRRGFGDRLITQVYINNQGPLDFLLDTAFSQTVLYEHVRSRLNLAPRSDPVLNPPTWVELTRRLQPPLDKTSGQRHRLYIAPHEQG